MTVFLYKAIAIQSYCTGMCVNLVALVTRHGHNELRNDGWDMDMGYGIVGSMGYGDMGDVGIWDVIVALDCRF